MALKYNNNNVTVIKYNNNDVKKVIFDGNVAWVKQYSVSLSSTSLTGVTSVFLATSATATSGSTTGTYDHGTTVYAIAKVSELNVSKHTWPSTWTHKQTTNGYSYFQIASNTLSSDSSSITISVSGMTAKTDAGGAFAATNCKWTVTACIDSSKVGADGTGFWSVYQGDNYTVSGTKATVQYKNAAGNWATRFELTASLLSDTAQYVYSDLKINTEGTTGTVGTSLVGASATATRTLCGYQVIVNWFDGDACWLSYNSTGGNNMSTGSTVYYGETIYGFALVSYSDLLDKMPPSSWTLLSAGDGYATFCIGSITLVPDASGKVPVIVGDDLIDRPSYTITLKNGTGSLWAEGASNVTSKTAYYGDKLYKEKTTSTAKLICKYDAEGSIAERTRWTVSMALAPDTKSTSYRFNASNGQPDFLLEPNPLKVTGATTVTAGPAMQTTRVYRVSIASIPTGADHVFLSTNGPGTGTVSGESSGSLFAYNSTVYAYVAVANSTLSNYYNAPSSYGSGNVSGTRTFYCVDSVKIDGNSTSYTFNLPALEPKPFSLMLPSIDVDWKVSGSTVSSQTVYYGDILRVVNGDASASITCSGKANFTATATRKANTAQYTYSGTPAVSIGGKTNHQVVGKTTATVSGVTATLRKYAVTVTKPSIADEIWLSTTSGASSGSASGATFDYGSTVYAMVKLSTSTATQYNISKDACGWTQTNANGQYNWYTIGSVNVTGAVTLTYTNPTKKSSKINISTSTGVTSVYLSTSSTATSGSASGTSFTYGTVYGFAKVAGSILNDYNIPSTWTSVSYDGSYYYYRVGSIQADGSTSRTISYTAMTAKPQLAQPNLTLSVSGTTYNLSIFNNNSTTVTVTGAWYNSSGTKVANISSFTLGSYSNSTSTTLAVSKADAVYASITLSASGYKSSTKTTSVVSGKLQAPQIVSTDVTSQSYRYEYRTNVFYNYTKFVQATIKNPNNEQVSLWFESLDISNAVGRGYPSTLAAGATGTVQFSANAGSSMRLTFNKDGRSSDAILITCPSDSSGGQT